MAWIANYLFFNSMDLGMAIGSFGLGIVADTSGYRNVYLAGVVLIVIAGLLYWTQTKEKKKEHRMVSHTH